MRIDRFYGWDGGYKSREGREKAGKRADRDRFSFVIALNPVQ